MQCVISYNISSIQHRHIFKICQASQLNIECGSGSSSSDSSAAGISPVVFSCGITIKVSVHVPYSTRPVALQLRHHNLIWAGIAKFSCARRYTVYWLWLGWCMHLLVKWSSKWRLFDKHGGYINWLDYTEFQDNCNLRCMNYLDLQHWCRLHRAVTPVRTPWRCNLML